MDGDEDSHAGDGYATPDGLGDISSIAQFMQGLAVQTRSTSDRLEWDGRQESWKDFWFRFKSMVHGSSAIKSEMLNPGHTPTTAARVKLFHVLVGLLSAPASGKRNKALQILQGYESNKGACAHDGFAALHAIIKTYGQRHESDAMRVEDELRNAMQKDDEDVDDWQLRLEALNADAEEHDVQLSDKRLQLGVVRGLRAAFDVARLLLGKAGSMEMDDLMETLRTAQNIMIHRGVLTNKGHKLPAAAPEIGGALYYTETGGGGDRNGAGGSAEMRTCWACGKPGHIVPNCPNQAAKDKYALEHPRRNRKPATDATPDGKHGGGKRKGACAFCDQDGHHISTCAVKKAITAGKQVGMVNGTMQVLATSAHEQLPLADTAGPYELLEDLEEGIQDFDINAFPVIAVQEKRTPEITTNGRARTHPYDVLNAGLNALDAVGDQGHRTEASDQRAVQAASYTVESEDTQRYWICDTAGGVISITSHSEDFHTLIAATGRVSGVAKGAYTEITGKGTVVVNISDKSGRPATVTFDAFLVPEADVGRLFSVANFDKAGGTGTVGGGAMTLTTPTGVVWVGALDDLSGHYHMPILTSTKTLAVKTKSANATPAQVGQLPQTMTPTSLWHARSGHANVEDLRELEKKGLVRDMHLGQKDDLACAACMQSKSTTKPYATRAGKRSADALEILHIDLWGPTVEPSHEGFYYMLTVVDDFTGLVFVVGLIKPSDSYDAFFIKVLKTEIPKFLRKGIKKGFRATTKTVPDMVQADYDTMFASNDFRERCENNGIALQFSCPYSHGQNGVVERKQRTLASKCIAQLVYAKLPKGFWWKAMRNAAMMTNISGTRAGDKELHVPMSMWTGEAPSWKNTRIFGCPATVARPLGSVPKGEPRGRMGIFVGNSFESLGWLIFYPDTNRVVTTMHADFDERWQSLSREHFEAAFKAVAPVLLMGEQANAKGKFKAVTWAQELQPLEPTQVDQGIKNDVATGMSSTFDDGTPPATRRSERVADRQLSSAQEHTAAAHVSEHISYLTQHAAGAGDPQSVPEAMRRDDAPQWRTAMEEEWEGLQINNTFEKMNLPPGKVAVDTKWVFKIKKDANGAALKHKGRLCIRGFNMRPGVHFFETYAPTVAIQHLRLVVALAAAHGWDICTTDVKQAYIQAKEENEVYVKQPRDFSDGSTKVLKLLRCLYGSPSAGRQWYKKLNGLLLNFGFDRSIRDECLYLLMTDTRKLIFCLAVHVDDLTGAGPGGLTVWNRLTEMLESNFGCVSVVNPSQILGMKVDRSEDGRIVTLSQPAYVQGMLDRYELAACNTRTVPIEPGTVFTRRDSPPEPNVERREEYQAKVGSLQYAATQGVRMDIAQAVGAAARVLQSPSPAHMTFVNGIFKYLAGNVERGITYDGTTNPEIQLECYADSDFAGQPHEMITADACKSTTGFVIMLAGGAIAWRSRLQKHTATSTGGAEVHAAYECGVEAAALSDVLGEMGFTQKPVIIHEDSNVCISMATSDTISMAHKALKVKYHWLRERVQAGELALRKVDTTLQHADYLTKALPRKTFEAHVRYTMGDKENRN